MARALYIHWPFCLRKCPYCDFNSHVRASVDHDLWLRSLLADMACEAAVAGGEPLETIFFGGGTPSLMPPALVEKLLEEAEKLWGFAPDIEITLEANPSSVEAASFAGLASAGVNRVSLGLQALDDAALGFLGRLHNVSESMVALEIAQAHFARVSIDLIYARPGQDAEAWAAELNRALSFGTGHMSLYQLTIEEGTRFATLAREGQLVLPGEDEAADLFALTRQMTGANGLPAYEVSNHARPGEESRHNLTYWRYHDYAGIGPGAHGRRGDSDGRQYATVRHKKPENWLASVANKGDGIVEARLLRPHEQAAEAMMMGLRLAEGVDVASLAARLGLAAETLVDADRLALYARLGLAWARNGRIGATPEGMPVLNGLIAELVPQGLIVPSPDAPPA